MIKLDIENEVFKRANVNFNKLVNYGFMKDKSNYIFEKEFLDGDFKAIINISDKGIVTGKVIDIQIDEEYTNIRTNLNGAFVNKVRESYKDILIDIKNNCFETNDFIFDQTNRINNYIKDKYNCSPEFLWEKFPGYAIYRNKNNNKWFAIIGNVKENKVNKKSLSSEEIEVINVKVLESNLNNILSKKGYYEVFHMNKKNWVSIILNDTLEDKEVIKLIDKSYNIINENEEWIVPANPKYYDVIEAFKNNDEIMWKQSSDIHVNDIVYLYVADPYSKIMYKCKAIEVDIPYEYKDNNLSMKYVMKIKLLKELGDKNYTFEYLNKIGIKAIRGPRKINKEISNKLK